MEKDGKVKVDRPSKWRVLSRGRKASGVFEGEINYKIKMFLLFLFLFFIWMVFNASALPREVRP